MADEQQPVAWMYSLHGQPVNVTLRRWEEMNLADHGWTETPLYARPTPQPAPDVVELVERLLRLTSQEAENYPDWSRLHDLIIAGLEAAEALTRLSESRQYWHEKATLPDISDRLSQEQAKQALVDQAQAEGMGYEAPTSIDPPFAETAQSGEECAVCGIANRSHFVHGAPFTADYHEFQPKQPAPEDLVEATLWHVEQVMGPISTEVCENDGDDDRSILKHNITAQLEQARREGAERIALSAYYDGWLDGVIVGKGLDPNEDMDRAAEQALFVADWGGCDTKRDPIACHLHERATEAIRARSEEGEGR